MSVALITDIRESTWAAIPGPWPGFPVAQIYIHIAIYTSTTGIPVFLNSSSSSTQHHHLTPQHPLECPQGGIAPQSCALQPGSDPLPGELKIPSSPNHPQNPITLLCNTIFPVLQGGGSHAKTKPGVAVSTRRGAAPSPKILISSGTRLGQGMPTPGSAGFSSTTP